MTKILKNIVINFLEADGNLFSENFIFFLTQASFLCLQFFMVVKDPDFFSFEPLFYWIGWPPKILIKYRHVNGPIFGRRIL